MTGRHVKTVGQHRARVDHPAVLDHTAVEHYRAPSAAAIRRPVPILAPSTCTECPIADDGPRIVGCISVQCSTQPSWTLDRSTISMYPWSPRNTVCGHTDACAATRTSPITVASGCT